MSNKDMKFSLEAAANRPMCERAGREIGDNATLYHAGFVLYATHDDVDGYQAARLYANTHGGLNKENTEIVHENEQLLVRLKKDAVL